MRGSLSDLLGAELARAIEELVDERIRAATADRDDGGSPTWFTLREAAEYLRISERSVSRMVGRGRIRVHHVGRRVLVHRDDLDTAAKGGPTGRVD